MTLLLELKIKLQEFYQRRHAIVRPILQFILAFVCFVTILTRLNNQNISTQLGISFACAAICSFLKPTFLAYFSGVIAIIEAASVSPVLGIAIAMLFVAIFLLIGRYDTNQLLVILAVPLCSVIHMSYVIPIVSALFVGPPIMIDIVLGVVIQYIYMAIGEALTAPELAIEAYGSLDLFQYVVDRLMNNSEMMIDIVAFVLSFIVTYVIRKRKSSHASHLAILSGAIVLIMTIFVGNVMVGEFQDSTSFILGIVVSVVVAYIIQFFRMTLDYTAAHDLQFEDDEYYYYVKAVPKMKMTVKEKMVTTINAKEEPAEVDSWIEEFDKEIEKEFEHVVQEQEEQDEE